ncbi:MAG: OsmC family protein [Pirellulaceae bacterium]
MDAQQLKALQQPLKEKYRQSPLEAQKRLVARGTVDLASLTCDVPTFAGVSRAGLHPATGGTQPLACSGEILLEAIVSCAGVTLAAVATAMGIEMRAASVEACGDLDFRGTLGIDKTVPVGFSKIELRFSIDSDAPQDSIAKLIELTERYCVVWQTFAQPPRLSTSCSSSKATP